MKRKLLPALLWAILNCYSVDSNAQFADLCKVNFSKIIFYMASHGII